MGVKSTAYSVTGTGLTGLGYIPLTVGTGLVTAGSYLIDAGNYLLNKGAECKLYADGLKALREGKMDKAQIEATAKACNCSFKAALIDAYIQMMQAQPTQQSTVQPTPQPQQVTLDQDNDNDNDDVATVMVVAEALV